MNHGAGVMSDKDKRHDGPDDATERELIEMEFQSMVENLSLDESAPTSYLDELDNFAESNKFIAPKPERKNLAQNLKGNSIVITVRTSVLPFLNGGNCCMNGSGTQCLEDCGSDSAPGSEKLRTALRSGY